MSVPAKAGDLVLFESWLRHEVPPARFSGERISISFNYGWSAKGTGRIVDGVFHALCLRTMRLVLVLLGLVAALLAWAAPAMADCPLDLGRGTGWVIFSDHYMIAFRPEPMRIEVGEPFALLLNVCTKSGNPAELVAVDAQLPDQPAWAASRPSYRPVTAAIAPRTWCFRKPGRWELDIDVRSGEESERLTHEIILK